MYRGLMFEIWKSRHVKEIAPEKRNNNESLKNETFLGYLCSFLRTRLTFLSEMQFSGWVFPHPLPNSLPNNLQEGVVIRSVKVSTIRRLIKLMINEVRSLHFLTRSLSVSRSNTNVLSLQRIQRLINFHYKSILLLINILLQIQSTLKNLTSFGFFHSTLCLLRYISRLITAQW